MAIELSSPSKYLRELLLPFRVLFFCIGRDELQSFGKFQALYAVVLVLLVGGFHHWDDPAANWFVRYGFEALVYLFFLTSYVWVLFALVGAQGLRFLKLFTFLSLTAPLAFIYSIPFDSFWNPYECELAGIFCAIGIISWRLALLAFYIRRVSQLAYKRLAVAIFIPVALISNFVFLSDVILTAVSHLRGVHQEFLRDVVRPAAGSLVAAAPASTQRARKRVSEATTTWLSESGRQLAERDDKNVSFSLIANSEPTYQDTIITPYGEVEIYSTWSVGSNRSAPSPAGFVKLGENDPIYQYRHPLAKLLQPVAMIGAVGIVPALLAYLIFMVWRPKENSQASDRKPVS